MSSHFVDVEEHPGASLANVIEQEDLKWIFVGGKGGVGKTTCSCSLAVQLAAVRSNVLIISTDPAHNLSDAFRQKFTRQPTQVNGFTNLFAMEVDPTPDERELEMLEDGASSFMTELASAIPGIDEAMSFAEVMRQVQTMNYSCIVFDTAPTGHTLRLLQFPTTLEKGLSKLMSLRGTFGAMFEQFGALFGGGANGIETQLLGKLDQLKMVVEEVNKQFKDPNLTTFICVCIPEFLSLYETERLVQDLAKYEIDCHNIIINQVIFPEAVGSSKLLQARVRMQQKYLDQFDELYEDFNLVKLPLLEEEVRGTPALKDFSKNLLTPYEPPVPTKPADRIQELEAEVARLRSRCTELESQHAA